MQLNDQIPDYWYTLAKHDIDSANLLRRENGHPDIVVYHLHQGIEKLLKGLILESGETFPFVHDLERLFKIFQDNKNEYDLLLEPVILLQSFYKELRYPQSEFLTAADMEKAYAAFIFILDRLKPRFIK